MPSQPLGPPQPSYIFRGHAHPIHHTSFIASNTRLLTGDAEGWIISWSLATRRPVAVWRAHEGAILDCREWGGRLITHGKDNKLIVWKYSPSDEEGVSKVLPVDGVDVERVKPWVLYVLEVNTLNFCSFGSCKAQNLLGSSVGDVEESSSMEVVKKEDDGYNDLLIAVPNTLKGENIDIFHLPSCNRLQTVPGPKDTNTGMVMAVSLLYLPSSDPSQPPRLTIVSGYESGHVAVLQAHPQLGWTTLYLSKPHAQPVLSIDVDPSLEKAFFLSSSADAVIAKHPLPSLSPPSPPASSSPSTSTQPSAPSPASSTAKPGSIAAVFASAPKPQAPPIVTPPEVGTQPLKTLNTKHAGQQSLRIRSDSRIYATAGWDGRARVYTAKTLKELAVLKWHKEGVYSVGFAVVRDGEKVGKRGEGEGGDEGVERGEVVGAREGRQLTVAEKRIREAERTHWVAVGGKDGKVSLWAIY